MERVSRQPTAVLELQAISLAGRQYPRLDQVSFCLWPGEKVALLGASGAGKTTLLTVANGLLPPQQGRLLWHGQPPARSGRLRRLQQSRIGTLWQDLRLIEELSVQQNLNAGRLGTWGWGRALLNLLLPLDTEANQDALTRVCLGPELLNQSVASLSGGQRQRVALARLLRQNPLLLLADEPLAHLDPHLAAELLPLLLAETPPHGALLLSLHRPDLLNGFDRVLALQHGKLVLDKPAVAVLPSDLDTLYTTPLPW